MLLKFTLAVAFALSVPNLAIHLGNGNLVGFAVLNPPDSLSASPAITDPNEMVLQGACVCSCGWNCDGSCAFEASCATTELANACTSGCCAGAPRATTVECAN